MAQFDRLTQRMEQNNVERALLSSDQPMRLVIAGRATATPTVLSMATLEGMVQEVIPANLQARLYEQGKFQFPYQAANGLYTIDVQRNNGTLQVSLVPLASATTTPARLQAVTPALADGSSPAAPALQPAPPTAQEQTFSAINRFKIPLAIAAALIVIIGIGAMARVARDSREQEKAAQVKQEAQKAEGERTATYAKYKQEIANLSNIGVNIRRLASDQQFSNGPGEDILIASEDHAAYSAAVASLQKRVKEDSAIDGTEASGDKAELLSAVLKESTENTPMQRAIEINKKAGQHVYESFSIYGKKAFDSKVVLEIIISFKGYDGLRELRRCDESALLDTVRTMFVNTSLVSSR